MCVERVIDFATRWGRGEGNVEHKNPLCGALHPLQESDAWVGMGYPAGVRAEFGSIIGYSSKKNSCEAVWLFQNVFFRCYTRHLRGRKRRDLRHRQARFSGGYFQIGRAHV